MGRKGMTGGRRNESGKGEGEYIGQMVRGSVEMGARGYFFIVKLAWK